MTLRLWTDLLDERKAPAPELAELYASWWEHELYLRELKHGSRKGELLSGQTPETSYQEIAAFIVATSVVAESRTEIADAAGISKVTAGGLGLGRGWGWD